MLEEVFRDEWGRVLASLVGFLGDFDRAEDAAQEAFAIAAERWPESGVPPNPGGWLVSTARNRAIDRIRRERTLAGKIHLLPEPEVVMDEFGIGGEEADAAGLELGRLCGREFDPLIVQDLLEGGVAVRRRLRIGAEEED